MKINKVKSIVRRKLKNFSSYDILIDNLMNSKNTNPKRDVNSFIKSKNQISCSTEIQAIRNIKIDEDIEEMKKWKEIIDFVVEESKNEYKTKGTALEYKYKSNMSNEMVSAILHISSTALNNWVNDFILEIGIIAIDKRLIKIDTF